MAKNKVKISKVEINIGGKILELSLKEAEELREILNETFGKTIVNSPTIIYEPATRPYTWPYQKWTVTTSGTSGSTWSSLNASVHSNDVGDSVLMHGGTLSLTANAGEQCAN